MNKRILFLALLTLNGCQSSNYRYAQYNDVSEYDTAEEQAEPAPPPEPEYRMLSFVSDIPNADIYLDRKYLCTVPCKAKIEGKDHEIDCQKNELHGVKDLTWDKYDKDFNEEGTRNSVDVDGTIKCLTDAAAEKEDEEANKRLREYEREEAEKAALEAAKAQNKYEAWRFDLMSGRNSLWR